MTEFSDELEKFVLLQPLHNAGIAQLLGRAASVIKNLDRENKELRVQLDGWKLYMQLRRDVAEIETLVKKLRKNGGERELMGALETVIERIVGREI